MPAPGDQHQPITNPFEKPAPRPSEYTAEEFTHLQHVLNQKLGPEYISTRPGPSGTKLQYVGAEKLISLANDVFGFNGWSSQIINIQMDYIDEHGSTGRISVGLSVVMRVTLRDGTFHEDVGYGQMESCPRKGAAFDKAKKAATTDALKRTLRNFGNVMGNCLYDKDYLKRIGKIKPGPQKPFTIDELYRHPDFCPPNPEAARDFGPAAAAAARTTVGAQAATTALLRQEKRTEPMAGVKKADAIEERAEPVVGVQTAEDAIEDLLDMDDFDEADFCELDEGDSCDILSETSESTLVPPTSRTSSNTDGPPPVDQATTAPKPAATVVGPAANRAPHTPVHGQQQQPQQQQPQAVPFPFQAGQAPNQNFNRGPQPPPPAKVGFFSARAVNANANLGMGVPEPGHAFNVHAKSPLASRTPGIDYSASKPVTKHLTHLPAVSSLELGAKPSPKPFMPPRSINPQLDQARRIGAPLAGGGSPLANRRPYNPPTKRPLPSDGTEQNGDGGGGSGAAVRAALAEVSANGPTAVVPTGEAAAKGGGEGGGEADSKRQKTA